jgi:SAM-dependent methyltransferase
LGSCKAEGKVGFEARKTNRIRDAKFLQTYFTGSVLDIGCGPDLVVPTARPFDQEHGDANRVGDYFPSESFDCVHSSHCLEHMRDIPAALASWWSLVKPGGYLVVVVPHEDLYELGYWPSLFNLDHKATFRLDTPTSWSPVSFELRALAGNLPDAEIIDIAVQDAGYDYSLLRAKPGKAGRLFGRFLVWFQWKRRSLFHRLKLEDPRIEDVFEQLERWLGKPVQQTGGEALAQIQAVVMKRPR